jgi:HK97 family phage major capsid protein
MKNPTELREENQLHLDEIDRVYAQAGAENRNPFDTEQTFIEGHLEAIEKNERLIATLEKSEAIKDRLSKPISEPLKPNPQAMITMVDRPQDRFPTCGEFLSKVIAAGNGSGSFDIRLKNAASGLNEGIPSDGGFLVQQDFSANLFAETMNAAVVAPRCDSVTISSVANSLKIPAIDETSRVDNSRGGGVMGYWLSEAAKKTASKPKFRAIELNLNKIAALCYLTDELMMDATALQSVVTSMFARELSFALETGIILGTGVGMPLGILNAPCLVTVNKEANQNADTVVYENICNMWSRLFAPCRPNAVWLINQDVEPQLFTMGITVGMGGSPVYVPPGGASAAPYGTLFGRPVIPIEQCSTLGDVGDIILADFSRYILAQKGGVQTAMSIHVRFEYDETALRFVMRVDGQPKWNAALTPYKGSNSQSPFVTLQAR